MFTNQQADPICHPRIPSYPADQVATEEEILAEQDTFYLNSNGQPCVKIINWKENADNEDISGMLTSQCHLRPARNPVLLDEIIERPTVKPPRPPTMTTFKKETSFKKETKTESMSRMLFSTLG